LYHGTPNIIRPLHNFDIKFSSVLMLTFSDFLWVSKF
jgi:hypothetical protein